MAKAELHTVRSSAKETGYTGKYIRDLLYEDRIPGARKVAGQWVIPASAVEELKRKKQVMDTVTTSSRSESTEIPISTRLLSDGAAKLEAASRAISEAASYLPADHGAVIQKFSERIELEYRLLRKIVFASRGGHRV